MAMLMQKSAARLGARQVAPKRSAVKTFAAREMWYPGTALATRAVV
jgi:hypothetical protein